MTDDRTIQSVDTAVTTAKQPSFFSIPGNPRIPAIVRAYGTIIRVANIMTIVLSALMLFAGVAGSVPGLVVGAILQVLVSSVLVCVGGVLREGKKAGVHALTVMAVLEVLAGLWLASVAKEGGPAIVTTVFGGVSILLGPPIVVAYKNWDKFD